MPEILSQRVIPLGEILVTQRDPKMSPLGMVTKHLTVRSSSDTATVGNMGEAQLCPTLHLGPEAGFVVGSLW